MTATKENEKTKVEYESDIITLPETFEKPLPIEQIPVFTLENCEILNSSLGSQSPKFGHNVQILLPNGSNFVQVDRTMRNNYLTSAQEKNPNLEIIKGSLTAITNKDILDGKYDEKYLNRTYINFQISNSYMFDRTVEDGKNVDKKIAKAEEAKGKAVVKYFRVIDQFTGEGIEPEVFKYVNGEKTTTFISPKTKQETPLYLNRGDIVNIKIRPFGVKNKKTEELSLRYNLLSIEIVQTNWERNGGKTSSSSKRVHEAPDSVDASALSDIFGGITNMNVTQTTTTKPAKVETKAEPKQEVKAEVKTETPKQEPVAETNEVPTLDFSALANMDFSGSNLGE